MTDVTALLRERPCLLLDFDGPICAVFSGLSNRSAALQLIDATGVTPPTEVASTSDPFDVLNFAASALGEPTVTRVEECFTNAELEAVRTARPTPHADAVIRSGAVPFRRVAVVSNNSSAAVSAYLAAHGLRPYIAGIFARTSSNVARLKPAPDLLKEAMASLKLPPERCSFVGDSVTDIQAAHAADIPAIAFANKPGKAERLAEYQPEAIITSMSELLPALS
ncbi:HAD family hydrolase [Nocardia sp. NPDC051570]|uniref:HAD family hydrolase n=1 Tax=Nocardia sp. NPDC051570 TaxID=3364324 RepID=UPI0037949569